MRLALLSNVTVEMLARRLGERTDVWTPSGYGAWMETALNPPPGLLEFAPERICILLDVKCGEFDGRVQSVAAAREALASRFPDAVVSVPDVSALLADLGEAAYDSRMWQLARQPWSALGLDELARFLVPEKKVLALDLDNTLWRGVVGEDGVSGIVPDVELQRQALELKSRGVLLTVVSRNDMSTVRPVWEDPRMVLKAADFAALRVNWERKSENLRSLADELGLGPDSFVFVDDDPGNRAEVRSGCPEVCVAAYPPLLAEYFPPRHVTEEDRRRTEMYRAEVCRREAAARLSYAEYLELLHIETTVRPMAEDEVARVAQLAQRTNQFTVSTNRWTEDEIRSFARDPSRLIVILRASDRFGELGLVGFVHAKIDGSRAEIVDWTMSCRAMNRRIEFALEAECERLLVARGVRELAARWKGTAKNGPVSDLFDRFSFELLEATPLERRYLRKLSRVGGP